MDKIVPSALRGGSPPKSGQDDKRTIWVDLNILERSRRPRTKDGIIFIVNFFAFLMYLVCFTMVVMTDRQTEVSYLLHRALDQAIPSSLVVTSLPQAVDYLADELLPVLSAEAGTSFIDANNIVGAVQIVQQRSVVTKCTDEALAAFDLDCLTGQDEAPFRGMRTNADFRFRRLVRCDTPFPCIVRTTGKFGEHYSRDGYLLSYFNHSLYVGETPYPLFMKRDLLEDFVTNQTLLLRVQCNLYNPQYALLTQMVIELEFPSAGGVLSTRQYLFLPYSTQWELIINVCNGFVWLYCFCWTFVTTLKIVLGWMRRKECVLCQTKSRNCQLASACWKCDQPITLEQTVLPCVWCKEPNPPVKHTCWKAKALDPWSLFTFINIIILIVARVIANTAKELSVTYVNEVESLIQQQLVPNVPFDRPMELFETAIVMNTVNILMAYICIYRFIGRAAWSATFLRVFSSGGVLLVFFFIGFLTVFSGFTLAFHLLLCDSSDQFTTFWSAFVGSFRAFMGFLSWDEVVADQRLWVFPVLYVIFSWLCLLVMLNVLISLVSVEYKKSTKTIHFDHESQSVALLLGPVWMQAKGKLRELSGRGSKAEKQGEAKKGNDDAHAKSAAAAVKSLVEENDSLNEVMSQIHERAEQSGLHADKYFTDSLHKLLKCNHELDAMNQFAKTIAETLEVSSSAKYDRVKEDPNEKMQ